MRLIFANILLGVVIKKIIEMNNIIKKFKGGSLSYTTLQNNNKKVFVRKSVSLTKNREYGFQRWYSQLKRIQRYNTLFPGLFPDLIDYGICGEFAYMDIEYFPDAVNVQEYIKNSKEYHIDDLFDSLICSMKSMHKKKIRGSSGSMELYLNEEIDQRLGDCMSDNNFTNFLKYDKIVFNGRKVKSFVKIVDEYKDMCRKYFCEPYERFTHGNITLENLLYIPKQRRVIFIDPYEENVIDSELAEYSQLLQSSNGKYEIYNSKDAQIRGNSIFLPIKDSLGINYFNSKLVSYLKSNFSTEDYIMIRLFEISQFIRMLPFKLAVDKTKMIFFYGLASYLYEELKTDIMSIEKYDTNK